MHKLALQDLPLKGKKVLLRADFNVPMNPPGIIVEDIRIRETLPSIEYILDKGGCAILMSHLGRPQGKHTPELSLSPVARRLSELLKIPVQFAQEAIGPKTQQQANDLKPGEILLLENLRFYAAEEDPKSDPSFAEHLAKLGNVYVNDAFGTAHRSHSSTAVIAQYFPLCSAAGLLMQKEIKILLSLLNNPQRPFYTIIGGAKVSTKIGVLRALLRSTDHIMIGGAMAYTFLKAQDVSIGDSPIEISFLQEASTLIAETRSQPFYLSLPIDHVIADAFDNDARTQIITTQQGIPLHWKGMDIGPQTISSWKNRLKEAGTIFWNGPLGVCEFPNFRHGTEQIARALSSITAIKIVGGGDSIAAIHQLGLEHAFTHLSTGGGASLEFLEYGHLPGIDALSDNPQAKTP